MKNRITLHLFASTMLVVLSGIWGQVSAQTTLIDPTGAGGFELGATFAANGWSSDNGTAVNQWYLGNVASIPAGVVTGARAAYVSADGGLTNGFNNTSASVVHFWRDVTVPAGETDVTLTFNWAALGESGSWDVLMISVAPVSYTPAASTSSLGTGTLAAPAVTLVQLWNTSAVQTASIKIPVTFLNNCTSASTFRLIFTWKNDTSGGTAPSGSVDNISLVSAIPPAGGWSTGGAASHTSTPRTCRPTSRRRWRMW
jgi:hypothetical protein